jgi:hypothetical protein
MLRLQLPYNSCATLTFFFLRSTIEYIGHTYKKTDPILISLKKKNYWSCTRVIQQLFF